jgi:hypothetical protein
MYYAIIKFALAKAMKTQVYSFFNLGARCGWVVNAKSR